MTSAPAARRFPWENLLATSAILAVARAAAFAAQDRYWSRGLQALAANSFARNALEGLPIALAGGVLLLLAPRVRTVRLLASTIFAAAAYLFLTARLPPDPLHVPGFYDLESRGAHIGSALLGLACAAVLACAWPRARAARILALVACVPVALAFGVRVSGLRTSSAPRSRPNVILISLDTLRADRLGCLGSSLGATPNIDRFFGQTSCLFRAAFAPMPFTLSSHMSLLTGLNPGAHGAGEKSALSSSIPTLAEELHDAGYLTMAQVDDIVWLHPRFGFKRGFQTYQRKHSVAAERIPSLTGLLDDLGAERFFLFLHFYDAHSDRGKRAYESDAEDRVAMGAQPGDDFRGREDPGGGTGLLWSASEGYVTFTPEERIEIARQYDAGVRTLDRAIGRLLEHLEESGLLRDTVVILTADHGEEFSEHGRWLHMQLYEESVHVPLLVRVPGASQAVVREEIVSLIDVMPTVLELCGVASRAPLQGESLVPLLAGGGARRRGYALLDKDGLGLRTPDWKLISRTDSDQLQLYGLREDPGEQRNLASAPEWSAELARLLDELHSEAERNQVLNATFHRPAGTELSPEEREVVRALGYVGEEKEEKEDEKE